LDYAKLTQGLAGAGYGDKIPALQKSRMEMEAKQAELEKLKTETAGLNYGQLQKRVEATNGALTSLLARPTVTHQDVLGAMQGLVQQGLAKPEEMQAALQQIPQDPAQLRPYLEQKRLEGLTAAERLKALTPNLVERTDNKRKWFEDANPITNPGGPKPLTMTTTPDADLSATTARRGQDVAAATADAGRAQAERHFQAGGWQYDGDRGGLVNTRTGEFKPATQGGVPLGQKDKALTEGQAKANLFGTRMQEADRILTQQAENGGADRPGWIKRTAESTLGILPEWAGRQGLVDAAGSSLNWTQSESQQKAEQAQRDFINAVLRRESGAAIAPSEFANAQKQYFPQIGDSGAVLRQKALNRQTAIKGMLAEVPEGKRTTVTPTAPPTQTAGGPPKVVNFSDLK
jgi:hypothetical protein